MEAAKLLIPHTRLLHVLQMLDASEKTFLSSCDGTSSACGRYGLQGMLPVTHKL